MDKILVTGGTGFVGHWMQKTQPPGTNCLYSGRSRADWNVIAKAKTLEEAKPEIEDSFNQPARYVVHLANISPTESIELARRNNARLLYCSSGAAYDQPGEYADNKRRWERECLSSGVDVVIARLFCFFGDRLDDGKAYTQFMRAARAGTPLRVWGDGSTVRSYLHGRDLGKQMWAILLRGERGETYDVGSDRPTTILQLARRIAGAAGCKIEMVDGDVPMPYYMPRNTAKTRKLLEEGR
jgi:nucleoside-diphosphate-sugar epimerase